MKPTILIVEDFHEARDMYAELFEHAEFRVRTARDGQEALAEVRSMRPDVMLLDLSLPRMSGWDVARHTREDPDLRHVRIVALTAHALPFSLDRARWAGCDRVFTKPIPTEDLVREVRAVLAERTQVAPR